METSLYTFNTVKDEFSTSQVTPIYFINCFRQSGRYFSRYKFDYLATPTNSALENSPVGFCSHWCLVGVFSIVTGDGTSSGAFLELRLLRYNVHKTPHEAVNGTLKLKGA